MSPRPVKTKKANWLFPLGWGCIPHGDDVDGDWRLNLGNLDEAELYGLGQVGIVRQEVEQYTR